MTDYLGSYTKCNNCGEPFDRYTDEVRGEHGTVTFESAKRGKRIYRLCDVCMVAMFEELLWSKPNE